MNIATLLMNTTPTKTLRMPACAGHLFREKRPRRMAGLLFTLGAQVFLALSGFAAPGQWTYTGSLNEARAGTVTLLPNGNVLVTGGITGGATTATAEIYNPATGQWTFTGSMAGPRVTRDATLLANGKVLVAAGYANDNIARADAEIYDPSTGTWSSTGSLNIARAGNTATLLPDGKVLVAGGLDSEFDSVAISELYDPDTGTWATTGSLNTARRPGIATLLPTGMVLVAGGIRGLENVALASAELYDPNTGTWSVTGSLNDKRYNGDATLLPNGMVLVAGGYESDFRGGTLASAELYNPDTGTWSLTGSLSTARYSNSTTLLPNGNVLVAGGFNGDLEDSLASAELYDPATGTWSTTGSLNTSRGGHAATVLPNGMVLVAGGWTGFGDLIIASAELYDPGITLATQVSGRGSIDGQGDTATFNFRANLTGDRPSGSLTFSDPAAVISITNAKVRTLTFNGNSADLGGKARLGDGTRVTYSVSVTDNSSDGSTDTFTITLSNGYSAGGTLTSGDIQIQ
jgi:N-acetylneuraminic acid mutarotase